MALERAPLVDGKENTFVVGVRGDVVAIASDGTERWRAPTLAAQAGPPAMLSDGAIVFLDAAGEAVAVRDGAVRWRVRVAPEDRRSEAGRAAPLPLDDGGVVVATWRDLVVLDSEGRERARTTLAEPTSAPLVAALGKVVAVTASGAVWTWTPGAPEPIRVASFGSPIDGCAAMADAQTLVAVTAAQAHVVAIDLVRGSTTTRAVAPTGAVWLGPPALRGGRAHVILLSSTGELEAQIAVTPTRGEAADPSPWTPVLLHARAASIAADGGAAPLTGYPHTPPLVDSNGTVAFATIAGDVGIQSGEGVDLLVNPCGGTRASGAEEGSEPWALSVHPASPIVVGLAPLGPGTFVVACRSGAVVAVRGVKGPGKPVAPALTPDGHPGEGGRALPAGEGFLPRL